jgi:hypothetical protein
LLEGYVPSAFLIVQSETPYFVMFASLVYLEFDDQFVYHQSAF